MLCSTSRLIIDEKRNIVSLYIRLLTLCVRRCQRTSVDPILYCRSVPVVPRIVRAVQLIRG